MKPPTDLERRLRDHLVETAPPREPERLFDAIMTGSSGLRQRPGLLAVGITDGGGDRVATWRPSLAIGLLVAALMAALIGVTLIGGARWLADDARPGPSARTAVVAITPGDPWVLYERDAEHGGGLFLMRPDGSDERQILTGVGGTLGEADWSPDGSRIAFTDLAAEAIRIANVDGTGLREIPCDGGHCHDPAWSPDGERIAFRQDIEGDAGVASERIWVMDLASGRPSKVTDTLRPVLPGAPRWSPDGSLLTSGVEMRLTDGTQAGSAIGIVPVTISSLRYVTGFESFATTPDWGADGIVFSVLPRGSDPALQPGGLFVIRPDGTDWRRIAARADRALQHPMWRPDGGRVLAVDPSTGHVVSVDVASGAITEIGGTFATVARLRPTP